MRCFFMKISSTAEQFKNEAERIGAYLLLQLTFPGKTILIPYYNRMGALSVDETSFSDGTCQDVTE